MPTSSQSQILSVVDYQSIQQQASGQNATTTTKPPVRISVNQTQVTDTIRRHSKDYERRLSIDKKNGNDHPPSLPRVTERRRSSDKTVENPQSARPYQRNDILHMPVINLHQTNQKSQNDNRQIRTNNTYGRTKSSLFDSSVQSFPPHRNSTNSDNDELIENEYKLNQIRKYTTPRSARENSLSASDADNTNDDDDDENLKHEPQLGLLNDSARRLLVLGTIRPSRSFYRNLPEADVNHLMEYFRRMKHSQRRMTSEEINAELATKYVEYKPKMFFDSACVTKGQVITIEKLIEQYADKIRSHKAEFVKLENPMRFVIRSIDNDTPLTTIPREYNDCFITLVTRSDPLRKSELVTDLVHAKFLEDIKANSLDISYFPGGVNYDVPRDEIDESGQMNIETYQKLKQRLNNRKVWYFTGVPEKKPNALLAIIPFDSTIIINHQDLYNNLNECLKTLPNNENTNTEQRILSIEFVPLSCILSSYDISNQFIIDCDTIETKRHLMEKPLKIVSNKQTVILEFQSYDETIQREYEKFIKSEKYRELIKNHDAAIKRSSSTK